MAAEKRNEVANLSNKIYHKQNKAGNEVMLGC